MKKTLLTLLGAVAAVFSSTAQTGSAEQPLSVDDFIEMGIPAAPVADTYVQGYIVGYVPGMTWSETIFGNPADAEAQKTNIVIAGATGETDLNYCIPVQLPAGDVRNALNLVDNPGNLHKKVTLRGSHEKYFGVNALKSVTAYAFDGQQITPEPTLDPVVSSLSENFASGIPSNWTLSGNPNFYNTSFSGSYYAAVTGYKGTPPFDAWLVTPGLKVDANAKTFSFSTQVNGYSSTTSKFQVYLLDSANPATANRLATIECPLAVAPESGYSGWVASGDLDLYALAGNKSGTFYVGFNYTASEDANYATWCLTDVLFNSTSTPEPVLPGDTGTLQNPLTVSQLLTQDTPSSDISGYFVKGVIVGFVDGMNISGATFGTAANASNTNILLADNADVKDVNLCIPVQLPSGAVRNGLNLVENPDNLFKTVTLEGSFAKYFGVKGLKSVKSFTFDGGETPDPQPSTVIFESLSSNANGWSEEFGAPLPEGLTYVWKWDSSYNNYKASAYANNTDYAADATVISPVITLPAEAELKLSFEHAGKFFSSLEAAEEECQLLVRKENGAWDQLTIENWFTNTDWTFVSTANTLNDYAGENIQIGLRYISTSKAGTWEVRNLKVERTDNTALRQIAVEGMQIRVIDGTIIAPADAEVYTLSGMRAGRENLQKGIYLVRSGNEVRKIAVK